MKITEIKRTVSGRNFDNISLTAIVEEGDDVKIVAEALDKKAGELLDHIYGVERADEKRYEKLQQQVDVINDFFDIDKLRKIIPDIPF
jgi:glycine/serine hydroxymethyltransferase